jgi:L-seryl-tRNA(Ser) seleniumtransferase
VDELLRDPRLEGAPHDLDDAAARAALEHARETILAGGDPGDLASIVEEDLRASTAHHLRRTINATGVIVHTNLGRAPLPEAAIARAVEAGRGYSNLEYDLEEGRAGRARITSRRSCRLIRARGRLVVNNTRRPDARSRSARGGRDVVVSRGELIEIGDGFRIPDVLARSGARLVEVGTTNRTRAADYERAVTDATAAILRVHQSNFRLVGFTEQPRLELSEIATATTSRRR